MVQQTGTTETPDVKQGAVAGLAAFVVGLTSTFLLATIDSEIELGQSDVGSLTETAWIFYGGHFVDMAVSFGGESETMDIFDDMATQFPELAYNLVPIVVLIGAGYLVATKLGALADGETGAKAGATVVAGYLPIALVGALFFEESESAGGFSASVGPDVAQSLLLAGIIFPLAFGAIGGFVAYRRAQ